MRKIALMFALLLVPAVALAQDAPVKADKAAASVQEATPQVTNQPPAPQPAAAGTVVATPGCSGCGTVVSGCGCGTVVSGCGTSCNDGCGRRVRVVRRVRLRRNNCCTPVSTCCTPKPRRCCTPKPRRCCKPAPSCGTNVVAPSCGCNTPAPSCGTCDTGCGSVRRIVRVRRVRRSSCCSAPVASCGGCSTVPSCGTNVVVPSCGTNVVTPSCGTNTVSTCGSGYVRASVRRPGFRFGGSRFGRCR